MHALLPQSSNALALQCHSMATFNRCSRQAKLAPLCQDSTNSRLIVGLSKAQVADYKLRIPSFCTMLGFLGRLLFPGTIVYRSISSLAMRESKHAEVSARELLVYLLLDPYGTQDRAHCAQHAVGSLLGEPSVRPLPQSMRSSSLLFFVLGGLSRAAQLPQTC